MAVLVIVGPVDGALALVVLEDILVTVAQAVKVKAQVVALALRVLAAEEAAAAAEAVEIPATPYPAVVVAAA